MNEVAFSGEGTKQRSEECKAIKTELLNAGIGMNGVYKQLNGTSEKLNGGGIHENGIQIESVETLASPVSSQDEAKTNGHCNIDRKYDIGQTTNNMSDNKTKTDNPPHERKTQSKESEGNSDKSDQRQNGKMKASENGQKRVELDKKTDAEERRRSDSMHEKKKEVEETKRQMGRRAETRSEQLSQVIGGAITNYHTNHLSGEIFQKEGWESMFFCQTREGGAKKQRSKRR